MDDSSILFFSEHSQSSQSFNSRRSDFETTDVRSFSLGFPVLVRRPSNFVPTLRPKLLNTSTKHLTRFSLDSEEYNSSKEGEEKVLYKKQKLLNSKIIIMIRIIIYLLKW